MPSRGEVADGHDAKGRESRRLGWPLSGHLGQRLVILRWSGWGDRIWRRVGTRARLIEGMLGGAAVARAKRSTFCVGLCGDCGVWVGRKVLNHRDTEGTE